MGGGNGNDAFKLIQPLHQLSAFLVRHLGQNKAQTNNSKKLTQKSLAKNVANNNYLNHQLTSWARGRQLRKVWRKATIKVDSSVTSYNRKLRFSVTSNSVLKQHETNRSKSKLRNIRNFMVALVYDETYRQTRAPRRTTWQLFSHTYSSGRGLITSQGGVRNHLEIPVAL